MSEVYIRLHLVIIFLITNLISVQLGFMMPPSPRAYCLAPRSEIVENERARFHISEEFIAQLSPIDVQLLEQIISGGVAKQSQLFKRHRHKVYRLVDEEIAVKPEGRTIYLDLERPIQIGERAIRVLRIKGVRPSTDDKGEAQVYLGWGRVPMKLIADEHGKITFVPSPYEPQPLGGAFLSFAQLEFQIAEENIKTKASWKVDYPIGWGEYEDKTFQGERLGFVIFGMGEADTRLTLLPVDTVTQDNVWFLFTRRYKNSHNERLLRPERMYQAIGRAIRAYHESGYFHGALHLGNIGVEKGGEEIFIRDLESTIKRSSLSGTLPQFVAYRFIDLAKPIFDLHRWTWIGDENNRRQSSATWMLDSLLQGYFFDMGHDTKEFEAMVSQCKQEILRDKLEDLLLKESGRKMVTEGFTINILEDEAFDLLIRYLVEVEVPPPSRVIEGAL